MIGAVDFAAKFSAFCVMDYEGNLQTQGDSWHLSENEFLQTIADLFYEYGLDVLVIEDLPHRLPFSALVKKTCRMQGRLLEKIDRLGYLPNVLFCPPALWQRTYEGIWKKGPEIVVPRAKELFDYDPPIDITPLHNKERQEGKKVNTDYCAAYLIARWALSEWNANNSFDAKSTSRYL